MVFWGREVVEVEGGGRLVVVRFGEEELTGLEFGMGVAGLNSCEVALEGTEEIGLDGDVVSDTTRAGTVLEFDSSGVLGEPKKNTQRVTPIIKRRDPPNSFSGGSLYFIYLSST